MAFRRKGFAAFFFKRCHFAKQNRQPANDRAAGMRLRGSAARRGPPSGSQREAPHDMPLARMMPRMAGSRILQAAAKKRRKVGDAREWLYWTLNECAFLLE